MNIGVMGGTFDPIHNGHVLVAEEARTQLGLSEVVFMPAGQPRLRMDSPVALAEHRLQMVRLAIAGKPYFRLSAMEVGRAGPSYTVDTIAALKSELDTGDELFFILGWDSLAELPRWREPSRLIRMCRLVVVPRPGYSAPDLNSLETAISGMSQRVILLDKPEVDISASVIRERVTKGLTIRRLVPEAVDEYIKEHKLYSAKNEG